MSRIPVLKTHKLFIRGAFPRTESGRTMELRDARGSLAAHLCRASRKDLRDAVEAAHAAQPGWQQATPYLRGQILHRLAEMLEGRKSELADAVGCTSRGSRQAAAAEVTAALDRVISMAGWCDKLASVVGGQNAVAGPYYNFTVPEPVGVVAVVGGDGCPLLGFLSLVLPALAAGNAVVAIAPQRNPLPALLVAESCPSSDLPGGVLNLLTGDHAELLPHVASHRDIMGVVACVPASAAATLRAGAAENLKRVHLVDQKTDWRREEPWSGAGAFEPFLEFKTIWHPAAT